jgi:hypothetical protein
MNPASRLSSVHEFDQYLKAILPSSQMKISHPWTPDVEKDFRDLVNLIAPEGVAVNISCHVTETPWKDFFLFILVELAGIGWISRKIRGVQA